MSALDEARIQEIVERVVARLGTGPAGPGPGRGPTHDATPLNDVAGHRPPTGRKPDLRIPQGRLGCYADPDAAIAATRKAWEQYERQPLAVRYAACDAIRQMGRANLKALAEHAVAETGLGRAEDKLAKNSLVIEKTPGPEILKPVAFSGDHGIAITERAPYGIIGAITPCTNPTETIICNAIGMLAAGNGVVFNVHPSAARVSAWLVHLINEAITAAGAPPNIVSCVSEPTIESAGRLMKHPGTRLIVVTGGPAVVKAAMNSGKKVIGAGPGNPPVVVDETAHLAEAARWIVRGGSFDNNIICVDEKEGLVVESVADKLIEELKRQPIYWMNDRQVAALEKLVIAGHDANKAYVGKNAGVILRDIGVHVGDDCRLAMCEVPFEHPFMQVEQLMPVFPICRVKDAAEAIARAVEVEHGYGHTSSMHSTNVENMSAMARVCNTSLFVKNAWNVAGLGAEGEGYTSFTIASPTGEGLTTAVHFSRERRCTLKDYFRFV
ncbi:MAG TPA: aldehyde dehydrogenase family protein [Polyangia bacterium]|jgi:acyl-CoA reductase-like NAD-dependent aldehyde dehydrogenase